MARRIASGVSAALLLAAIGRAQTIDPELLQASVARPLGPAAPGGRIVDVAVHYDRPWELWAASASGGVWKSLNNGTTWNCVFAQALSIGDIAIANSDPNVLWIGTGEGNNQRSSYAGNGVWRSTDGGKSFEQRGLADSHHIGRVAVHPLDAAVAYVAALGPLYSTGGERGLWKTIDGGTTWELVLGLGDAIGVADVVIDPDHPETVYAASYERRRRAWHFEDAGASAIYRSRDGGTSWRRLSGGLPSGNLGRIGLALALPETGTLYACIDNQNLEPVVRPAETPTQAPTDASAAAADASAKKQEPAKPRPIGGEVWRSVDGGRTWEKRNEKPVSGEPPYYYGQIRVDPHDRDHIWLLGIQVFVSKDGGKTFSGDVANSLHSDHHALWFDPVRRGRLLLGNDGGLAQSYDAGATFDYYPNLSIAQFYTVSVDVRRPYCVYGGLQDNGVWMGPSRGRGFSGVGSNEWRLIGGGDGMYVLSDPQDPDTVYLESQFGALSRTNTRTGESTYLQPRGAEGDPQRFNWCSPLVLSSHNSRVLYFGSQRLWRSLDRGDHWKAISGDLTTNDAAKLKGNVPHCTLTTISESPLDPDVLLVGSDDGKVQWTRDSGHSWNDCSGRFPGLPPARWVSGVELSRHDSAVAWVTFSGYREDDFAPWVYRTKDGGETFVCVVAGLPDAPVNVLHESPRRKETLFLASDGGAFFSIDGGDHWMPLASDLPLVSVLDLAVHPREPEVVLGTHGRGLFVIEVTAHEQLDAKVTAAKAHLFAPATATAWRPNWLAGGMGWNGDRGFRAQNPEAGAPLWIWRADGEEAAKLELLDAAGKVVRKLDVPRQAGLQRVMWDLRADAPPEAAEGGENAKPGVKPTTNSERRRYASEPGDFAQDAPARRRRGRGGEAVAPGRYVARLTAGATVVEQPLELRADPGADY
ncbi:MAG: hypothetical protein EXS13_05095 [Planctomycetes bacterium]|nr:hypothetical protein [Planctomycetota bacterium]